MGTWGAQVFADDLALDIRTIYLDLLGNGLSGPEATKRLIDDDLGFYLPENEYNYDPRSWIALAEIQWRVGRLEEEVKEQALAAIDNGWDIATWLEGWPEMVGRRRQVLTKLRKRLSSPQPPPKRIRPRYIQQPEFDVGDVIRYTLRSGRFALFVMVAERCWLNDDVMPVIKLLHWVGEVVPDDDVIRTLPPWPMTKAPPMTPLWGGSGSAYFTIWRATRRDFPKRRLRVVMKGLPVEVDRRWHGEETMWKHLDAVLEMVYGLT